MVVVSRSAIPGLDLSLINALTLISMNYRLCEPRQLSSHETRETTIDGRDKFGALSLLTSSTFLLSPFLERKYGIEEGSLEGKYKDWQKKLHPDLVYSKSETEREYAAEQSARVIDAYRTLNNRLARAIYLMKLHGVHVDEVHTVSDPDLLAEAEDTWASH